MDNEQVRGLLADLAKDDPAPRLAGVLEIRAANFLREHGARLLADSDELAALRARIAGAAVQVYGKDDWHEPLIGQRVALLRLPAGEGE